MYELDEIPPFEELDPYDKKRERELRKKDIPVNLVGDKETLSDSESYFLQRLTNFSLETAIDYQDHFRKVLRRTPSFGPRLQESLAKNSFSVPRFTIVMPDKYSEVVEDLGFPQVKNNPKYDQMLLIMQLPKPIERWWWKGKPSSTWWKKHEDIQGMVAEYGNLYEKVTPIIWSARKDEEKSAGYPIQFARMNEAGVHNEKYYYVWNVTLDKKAVIFARGYE